MPSGHSGCENSTFIISDRKSKNVKKKKQVRYKYFPFNLIILISYGQYFQKACCIYAFQGTEVPFIIAWVQEVSETLLHSRLLLIYRPLTLVHPFEMNCFKLSSIPQACNQTIIALYFPLLPSSPQFQDPSVLELL